LSYCPLLITRGSWPASPLPASLPDPTAIPCRSAALTGRTTTSWWSLRCRGPSVEPSGRTGRICLPGPAGRSRATG